MIAGYINNNMTVTDEIVSGTAIPAVYISKPYSIHELKHIMNTITANTDFFS